MEVPLKGATGAARSFVHQCPFFFLVGSLLGPLLEEASEREREGGRQRETELMAAPLRRHLAPTWPSPKFNFVNYAAEEAGRKCRNAKLKQQECDGPGTISPQTRAKVGKWGVETSMPQCRFMSIWNKGQMKSLKNLPLRPKFGPDGRFCKGNGATWSQVKPSESK